MRSGASPAASPGTVAAARAGDLMAAGAIYGGPAHAIAVCYVDNSGTTPLGLSATQLTSSLMCLSSAALHRRVRVDACCWNGFRHRRPHRGQPDLLLQDGRQPELGERARPPGGARRRLPDDAEHRTPMTGTARTSACRRSRPKLDGAFVRDERGDEPRASLPPCSPSNTDSPNTFLEENLDAEASSPWRPCSPRPRPPTPRRCCPAGPSTAAPPRCAPCGMSTTPAPHPSALGTRGLPISSARSSRSWSTSAGRSFPPAGLAASPRTSRTTRSTLGVMVVSPSKANARAILEVHDREPGIAAEHPAQLQARITRRPRPVLHPARDSEVGHGRPGGALGNADQQHPKAREESP